MNRAVGILAKDLRSFVHHFKFLNTVVEKVNQNPEDSQKSLIQYFQSYQQVDKTVDIDLEAEVIEKSISKTKDWYAWWFV